MKIQAFFDIPQRQILTCAHGWINTTAYAAAESAFITICPSGQQWYCNRKGLENSPLPRKHFPHSVDLNYKRDTKLLTNSR